MKKQPELTLSNIRKLPQFDEVVQASDLLSEEDREKLRQLNARSRKEPRFDENDAFVAEIIARFGYEAYVAWNMGSIKHEKMEKLLAAERAREQALMLPLVSIVMNMVSACIKVSRKEKKPKGPKEAVKVFKQMVKIAKGEA